MAKRVINPDETLAILYNQGVSTREMAETLGMSRSIILRRLRSLGVDIRSRGGPNHINRVMDTIMKVPEAKKILSNESYTQETKAQLLGVHPNTLRSYLRSKGEPTYVRKEGKKMSK